jgi:hypothetical protein
MPADFKSDSLRSFFQFFIFERSGWLRGPRRAHRAKGSGAEGGL